MSGRDPYDMMGDYSPEAGMMGGMDADTDNSQDTRRQMVNLRAGKTSMRGLAEAVYGEKRAKKKRKGLPGMM